MSNTGAYVCNYRYRYIKYTFSYILDIYDACASGINISAFINDSCNACFSTSKDFSTLGAIGLDIRALDLLGLLENASHESTSEGSAESSIHMRFNDTASCSVIFVRAKMWPPGLAASFGSEFEEKSASFRVERHVLSGFSGPAALAGGVSMTV